jgi:predicted unusual protein kinase regulating ubiquinone biosynthesis (AarF/ABC1/UbiB family)
MLNNYKFQKISKIVRYGIEIEIIRSTNKNVNNRFIGKWMKNKCISLGPTFIKIGQFMSTRKDIFGKDFTDELKELQDNVDPFDFKELKEELEPFQSKFLFINDIPLASASIGQVHRAVLLNGKEVVIKARRPGIIENIKNDFELVLSLLEAAKYIIPSRRLQEINILFEEYYKLLIEEIDFNKERNNMKQFQIMFNDIPWIKIPHVYDEISNQNIITMEYVPAVKLDNTKVMNTLNFNKKLIADKLMEAFIIQIIDYGIVHIDLHYGNIAITKNGKIVFYDYGMILKLDPKIKDNFNSLLLAVYEKDVNEICNIAIELDLIVIEKTDIPSFKNFIYYFLNYLDTLDINNFKIDYLDKINQNNNLNFMLSSKFLMLIRGITILEGICKELDPNFSYIKTLEPYINNMVKLDINYIENKAQKDFDKLFKKDNNNNNKNEIDIEIIKNNMNIIETKINGYNQISKNGIFITVVILLLHYL